MIEIEQNENDLYIINVKDINYVNCYLNADNEYVIDIYLNCSEDGLSFYFDKEKESDFNYYVNLIKMKLKELENK